MKGKADIVKVLIKAKAEINALDGHGETPLIKVSGVSLLFYFPKHKETSLLTCS